MSKFAVRALADALYYELGSAGIAVTHIAPGFVASEIRQVDNQGVFHDQAKRTIPDWLEMPTEPAARQIVAAVRRRKHEQIVTLHAKAGILVNRLFPGLARSLVRLYQRKDKG